MVRDHNAQFEDLMILPHNYAPHMGEDLLFVILIKGKIMFVYVDDIPNLTYLFESGAWDSWDNYLYTLRKGEWSFKFGDDLDQTFIQFFGKRHGTINCQMKAFSILDILPEDIMKRVNENNWRIRIENPTKALDSVSTESGAMYVDKNLATILMNVPLAIYSLESGRRIDTMYLDIRRFENINFSHTDKYCKESCSTNLDLFDAMMFHGKLWKVNTTKDLLYLPILPRPCIFANNLLVPVSLNKRNIDLDVTFETFFSECDDETKSKIVKAVFPYSFEAKNMQQELLKRVSASGHSLTKHCPCLKFGSHYVCMTPTPVEYL